MKSFLLCSLFLALSISPAFSDDCGPDSPVVILSNPFEDPLDLLVKYAAVLVRGRLINPPNSHPSSGGVTRDVEVRCVIKGTVERYKTVQNGYKIIEVEGFLDKRRCTYLNYENSYILFLGKNDTHYGLLPYGTQPYHFSEKQLAEKLFKPPFEFRDCTDSTPSPLPTSSLPTTTPTPCDCAPCNDSNPIDLEIPPWGAKIWNIETFEPLCDAIMIGCNLFLTSASCVRGHELVHLLIRRHKNWPSSRQTVIEVSPHPKYEEDRDFDIAFLRMESGVCFDGLKPICLESKSKEVKRDRLVVYHTPTGVPAAERVRCQKANYAFLNCALINESKLSKTIDLDGSSLVAELRDEPLWIILGVFKRRYENELTFTRINRAPVRHWIDEFLHRNTVIRPVEDNEKPSVIQQINRGQVAYTENKSHPTGNEDTIPDDGSASGSATGPVNGSSRT